MSEFVEMPLVDVLRWELRRIRSEIGRVDLELRKAEQSRYHVSRSTPQRRQLWELRKMEAHVVFWLSVVSDEV